MNTAIIIAVSVAWVGLMMFMAWALINLRTKLDRKIDELAMESERRRRTEKQALALVEKVTPLIEQTDWMTGRWHGQYNTLVRLEADRNAAVVTARRALWTIPLVADHLKNNYGASK
ncbi:hypothetical protein [Streptomyces sp. NPDC002758]